MTAFRATYSDFKLIKTRQAVQIVFEIPLHDVDAALEVLGGMPTPSSERWFGIAPLTDQASAAPQPVVDKPPAGAKREWRDCPPQKQAGIRGDDPVFIAFLEEERSEEWRESMMDPAECIRLICGVRSRSELGTNQKARVVWHQLDSQFLAWKAVEHA